jgi:hypothetical protein
MKRFILLAVLVALVGVASVLGATTASAKQADPVSVPISGAQSSGVLNGVLTITGFAVNSAGDLVATGTFTGTALIDGVLQDVTGAVSVIVQPGTATCQILDLTLGPLHLDLLGLVVDLNQVHLTITAVPGPGNLLGNLLCTVAHLLDNGVPTTAVANLLNVTLGRL